MTCDAPSCHITLTTFIYYYYLILLLIRWLICTAVPTAPRDLRLSLTQLDPPIVLVTWTRPAQSHGSLGGYKLTYGVISDLYIEERRFDADKTRFTTGFLGMCHIIDFYVCIMYF